jgi:thiol-disulfide isomerase/thioredoxin
MKQYLLILFTFLSIYSFGQQSTNVKPEMNIDSFMRAHQTEAIGKPFPLFTASFKNKVFTNQNLMGKIVFINFWFASCAPCIAEFDALNELYEKFKTNRNFEFISFTYETPETIKELSEKYKIKYKVISIKQEDCYRLNQNSGFPTSIMLDKKGTIKVITFGGSLDKAVARDIIFSEFYPKLMTEL